MGKRCADHWTGIRVHIHDDPERPPGLTDWMQAIPYRVVSSSFATLLQKADAPCEFLPLSATYGEGVTPNKYFALNVLEVVREAIDLEASALKAYDAELRLAAGVEKLVLLPDLSGAAMFYLCEIGTVAVSDELAESIHDEGMLGCRCVDPSDFQK
jgi:hypothetical protein